MTTETPARPLPRPLAWLLAPARWLERARGRRRLALASLYLLIIAVAMVLGWRATSLNRLPDIGDPFDVRAFTAVEVPDAENAFVLYREAVARHKDLSKFLPSVNIRTTVLDDWSKAGPEVRRWLEENHEALEIWRRGTERPKALYIRPGELSFETLMPVVQELRDFARLAILEASRREQGGDVEGAWAMYRGMLRASRHVGRHGCAIQRLVGVAIFRIASPKIVAWAADPKVDARLLRRALADVRDGAATTPPNSEMLKLEYLAMMKALALPDSPNHWLKGERAADSEWSHLLPGYWPIRDWLLREPERSRRVVRLVFANWLAECDLPRGDRPPFIRGPISLYRRDPGDLHLAGPQPADGLPKSAGALPPEELAPWFETATLARMFLPAYEPLLRATDAERPILDGLVVTLAEQLYAREHGGAFPKRLGDLVGPYLDTLPDGYSAGDPPAAAPPAGK